MPHLQYVAVKERHKDGTFRIHMVLIGLTEGEYQQIQRRKDGQWKTCPFKMALWKVWSAEGVQKFHAQGRPATGGGDWFVDVAPIGGKEKDVWGATTYLSKYMTKDTSHARYNLRMFWASHGMVRWEVRNLNLPEYYKVCLLYTSPSPRD